MKVIIGAGTQRWDSWIPTEQDTLDLTDPASFAAYFGGAQADAFLCEHVWEHLSPQQGAAAARLVFQYLKPGGYLRVAAPDGYHPSAEYLALVAVHGPGPAAEHQVLYTLETFAPQFTQAGFQVRALEWWDAGKHFHRADWDVQEAPVGRCSFLDDRNAAWRAGQGELEFTSLILDARKPLRQ